MWSPNAGVLFKSTPDAEALSQSKNASTSAHCRRSHTGIALAETGVSSQVSPHVMLTAPGLWELLNPSLHSTVTLCPNCSSEPSSTRVPSASAPPTSSTRLRKVHRHPGPYPVKFRHRHSVVHAREQDPGVRVSERRSVLVHCPTRTPGELEVSSESGQSSSGSQLAPVLLPAGNTSTTHACGGMAHSPRQHVSCWLYVFMAVVLTMKPELQVTKAVSPCWAGIVVDASTVPSTCIGLPKSKPMNASTAVQSMAVHLASEGVSDRLLRQVRENPDGESSIASNGPPAATKPVLQTIVTAVSYGTEHPDEHGDSPSQTATELVGGSRSQVTRRHVVCCSMRQFAEQPGISELKSSHTYPSPHMTWTTSPYGIRLSWCLLSSATMPGDAACGDSQTTGTHRMDDQSPSS
eukprot:36187-Rhodomonas_salina.3